MPGGARPNAGRPMGSRNQSTKYHNYIEQHAARMGDAGLAFRREANHLSPLDMLCCCYKIMFGAYLDHGERKDLEMALAAASQAAPYLHPRISALTVTHEVEHKKPEQLTDGELQKLIGDAAKVLASRSVHNMIEAEAVLVED